MTSMVAWRCFAGQVTLSLLIAQNVFPASSDFFLYVLDDSRMQCKFPDVYQSSEKQQYSFNSRNYSACIQGLVLKTKSKPDS